MSEKIHIHTCPNCDSKSIKEEFTAIDHTVSHETFAIWSCAQCTFKFTQDIPSEESIGAYYKSDDYISHSDKKEGLMDHLYHRARNYMLRSKKNLVQKHHSKKTGKLLDIGTGTGYFLDTMLRADWEVMGIEADEETRNYVAENFAVHVYANEQLFKLESESQDAITMWHVLEHVHQLDEYLAQIHSILKTDGHFIVAIPNHTAREVKNYKENWAAWDVPRHLYHWNTEAFSFLMKKNGFEIIERKTMPFDPFYIALLSEKYKNEKGNPLSAIVNGIQSLIAGNSDIRKSSSVIYVMKKK